MGRTKLLLRNLLSAVDGAFDLDVENHKGILEEWFTDCNTSRGSSKESILNQYGHWEVTEVEPIPGILKLHITVKEK